MTNGNVHWNVEFEKELSDLINRLGVDAKVGFPDFLLARFMTHTLWAFDTNLKIQRESYPTSAPEPIAGCTESHNATPQQHQTATSAENHNETDS